jgi:hypothetical protein
MQFKSNLPEEKFSEIVNELVSDINDTINLFLKELMKTDIDVTNIPAILINSLVNICGKRIIECSKNLADFYDEPRLRENITPVVAPFIDTLLESFKINNMQVNIERSHDDGGADCEHCKLPDGITLH